MVAEVDPNESRKVTTMLTRMTLKRHNFVAVVTQAIFPMTDYLGMMKGKERGKCPVQ
jgi:hypothetical protein